MIYLTGYSAWNEPHVYSMCRRTPYAFSLTSYRLAWLYYVGFIERFAGDSSEGLTSCSVIV